MQKSWFNWWNGKDESKRKRMIIRRTKREKRGEGDRRLDSSAPDMQIDALCTRLAY
jgi:hypothetical protein